MTLSVVSAEFSGVTEFDGGHQVYLFSYFHF